MALRCSIVVEQLQALCAERQDFFTVSLRLQYSRGERRFLRRSGFREYHRALWDAGVTKACSHSIRSRMGMTLPLDSATVLGFPHERALRDLGHRIIIYLATDNSAARWRALIGVQPSAQGKMMLRTNGYCSSCALDQAMARPGRCYLIL